MNTSSEPSIHTIPELLKLESERLAIVKEIKLICIFGPIATIVAIALWFMIGKYAILIFTLLIFLCFFGSLVLLYRAFFIKKNHYRNHFRQTIMASMLKIYKPEMNYEPLRMISPSLLEASEMFPTNANQYFGSNYMSLQEDDFFMEKSEVKSYVKKHTSKNGTDRFHVFAGTFFSFKIKKNFQGYTVILSEKTDWLMLSVQKLNYRKYNKITLEDKGFEADFDTYSSDENEVNRILTPDFKKAMYYLRDRLIYPIIIAFANDQISFAVARGHDSFSPSLYTSLLDPNEIKRFSYRLEDEFVIIDTLRFFIKQW